MIKVLKDEKNKLKKIQAFLFGLGVNNPSYKLAKDFYRFLKENDYYVKVGLKVMELKKTTIDDLKEEEEFDSVAQRDEWVEYSGNLLREMFLEFTKSKPFSTTNKKKFSQFFFGTKQL